MADRDIDVAPHIVIGEVDEDSQARVHYLDTRIHENPEVFQRAIATVSLGRAATVSTVTVEAIETNPKPPGQEAHEILAELFSQRLDLEIIFDPTTEAELKNDSSHQKLLEKQQAATSYRSRLGEMKHELVRNPNAEPTRDAVRRNRVAFYIERVLMAQDQNQQSALSLAG